MIDSIGNKQLASDVLAVRKVVKLGECLMVALPARFHRREKIEKGDYFVWLDRGVRLTGTSLKQYQFDVSLKHTLQNQKGAK